jgi:4-hydroxy-3-methylbut-2-enyl diphosphate reductase
VIGNHPEILGILGYINGDAFVVKSVDEVRRIAAAGSCRNHCADDDQPEKYRAIAAALADRAREVKVCETICDATEENQSAVRELASEVELIYVIGGKHSANSNKLVDSAVLGGARALLIETPDGIVPGDLIGLERVGVTAGASTPDWMIQRVVERLREIDRQHSSAG